MSFYFENYTLYRKLQEYGELCTCKKALKEHLLNVININDNNRELFNKIESGETVNLFELGDLVDEMIKSL